MIVDPNPMAQGAPDAMGRPPLPGGAARCGAAAGKTPAKPRGRRDGAADGGASGAYDVMAFRYRICPTPAQEAAMRRIGGCRRAVYNWALAERNRVWREANAARAAGGMAGGGVSDAVIDGANDGSAMGSASAGAGGFESGRAEIRGSSYQDQQNLLPALKAELAYLKEAPSHCLQAALRDLDAAFRAFFDGRARRPRFARHSDGCTFRFPDPAQFRIDAVPGARMGLLVLPKFGRTKADHGAIAIRIHRPWVGEMRRITITEEAGQWFASIECRSPRASRPAPAVVPRVTALDRGARKPFVASRPIAVGVALSVQDRRAGKSQTRVARVLGEEVETDGDRAHTARLRQRLARTKGGRKGEKASKNRAKARRALARHLASLRRKRTHMVRVCAQAAVRSADVIVLEHLPMQALTKGPKAMGQSGGAAARTRGKNRRMADVSLGEFARRVEILAERAGKRVIYINPAHTSQTCAACGHCERGNRPNRDRFACLACGHTDCADANASRNILRKGWDVLAQEAEAVRGTGGREGACKEMDQDAARQDTHRGSHGTGLHTRGWGRVSRAAHATEGIDPIPPCEQEAGSARTGIACTPFGHR